MRLDNKIFFQNIPLFAKLPAEDLDNLVSSVYEKELEKGEILFQEGDPADEAYIIKAGKLEILKETKSRKVLIAIREKNELIGEVSLFQSTTRTATIRARVNSTLICIEKDVLDNVLERSPGAAKSMLHTILARFHSQETLMKNNEKMIQLGTLSAGLAHELNNPSTAIVHGSNNLKREMDDFFDIQLDIDKLDLQVQNHEYLADLRLKLKTAANSPVEFDSLARSDEEYAMEELLEEIGIDEAWEYASTFVDLQFTKEDLETLTSRFKDEELPIVIKWLEKTYTIHKLQNEVHQGAERVSAIVKALKDYSYLDQTPLQEVDLHKGIDNTLLILQNKLKYGINVIREYDPNLPSIQAYGGELNQVWTNLIDNAADALTEANVEQPKLTIRTRHQTNWIIVDFEDNGPGIPKEIQDKIFNPFFTTKAPGKGTGLGLDISYNIIAEKHHGDLRVYSSPGSTCFRVFLPLDIESVQGHSPFEELIIPPDEELLAILDTTKSILVYQIGDPQSPDHPSFAIPSYLHDQGFDVYGVNEAGFEVFGRKAFSSFDDISGSFDLLLLFVPQVEIPPLLAHSKRLDIKTIWMQEGVVNEELAEKSIGDGFNVVMDHCIRNTHSRLLS